MTNSADISVIIPTAGREQLLRAIESIINQTVQVSEIILVIDGAQNVNSDLLETVTSICNDLLQIVVIKHQSGGPAKPRNVGLALARYPWVAFLDDDDWWLNDKIEHQLPYLQNKKIVAIGSNALSWNHGKVEGRYFEPSTPLTKSSSFEFHNPLILSTVIARKSALVDVGGFPEDKKYRGIDDYMAWRRLTLLGKIINLDQATVFYRKVDKTSLSSDPSTQHNNPAEIAREYLAAFTKGRLIQFVKRNLLKIAHLTQKIGQALDQKSKVSA